MRLFLIYRGSLANDRSLLLLQKSAEEKNIPCVLLDSEKFDFIHPPKLEKGDALYRIANGIKARKVERFLIQEDTATLYQNNTQALFEIDETALHKKKNLKTPITFPLITEDESILKKLAEVAGGYPLIIKTLGKSHGVGVQKIEDEEMLLSVAKGIVQKKEDAVIKQYIEHERHARLIVLNNKVITSIAYYPQGEDFRTNVGDTIVVAPEKFSSEIERLAIAAVNASGYDFGGVDILLQKDTADYFLAEVNFPCFFPRAQEVTEVNVASMIIDALQKKSLAINTL